MNADRKFRMNVVQRMMICALGTSQGSTCQRRAVGCVLTLKGHVVATGYNGSVPNEPHCLDSGCYIVNGHCIRTTHAETNACLRVGVLGADTAYCTDKPCISCTKALLSQGVSRIYYWRNYHDPERDQYEASLRNPKLIVNVSYQVSELLGRLEQQMEMDTRGITDAI